MLPLHYEDVASVIALRAYYRQHLRCCMNILIYSNYGHHTHIHIYMSLLADIWLFRNKGGYDTYIASIGPVVQAS